MWSPLQIWRVEADTPIAYYLLHLISSLFWPAHISRNNKYCLKSKCGVSWDASWVLRCGGQTCRRDVWQILGEYNTWRRGRQVSLRHNLWHSQYTQSPLDRVPLLLLYFRVWFMTLHHSALLAAPVVCPITTVTSWEGLRTKCMNKIFPWFQ